MNDDFKKIISIIGIIGIAALIYFGSILPFVKSRLYLEVLNRLNSVKNVGDIEDAFDSALNFYSPVGQEEITRYISNNVLSFIDSKNPEAPIREIAKYMESRMFKNNTKHLLTIAWMHERLAKVYNQPADLKIAEEYYQKVLILNPKSPQALYGLLTIYQVTEDKEKSRQLAEKILQYWPDDKNIEAIIAQ